MRPVLTADGAEADTSRIVSAGGELVLAPGLSPLGWRSRSRGATAAV